MAGVYVHIPFCARRCSYCDFFSTLQLAKAGGDYVEALIAEAAMRRGELRGEPVTTLYLGGGTPSLLPSPLLSRLVVGLKEAIDLSGLVEFTVEANPDDVTAQWCAALSQLGVNRVSMGVQSFEDDILRLIGRRHTARQAVEAVGHLRGFGITNVSIDLIFGLPGQTVTSWTESVRQAIDLAPSHMSAYGLTYEEGTRLWHQRERGEVIEVPEQQCLEMYRILIEELQAAGYEHYEISNFALPGYVEEQMTWQERYDERVMLGLRTSEGVDAGRLCQDFGDEAWQHFTREARRHLQTGNLRVAGDGNYVLSRDGIMLSDSIIRDLMWDE